MNRNLHPSERGLAEAPPGASRLRPRHEQRIDLLTRCAVGGGYDISASTSTSASAGSRAGEGDFTVYGPNRNPPWVMPVIIAGLALAAFFLWRWLKK